MHPKQLFILSQLIDNERMRYSDMRPLEMEASQFMYHLKSLIRKGLVQKQENLYLLTANGKQFIDKFDKDNLTPFDYPRVTMAFAYEHKEYGMLMITRNEQPAIGMIGFMLADIPINYTPPLTEYAATTFRETTGIDTSFAHRASGFIRLTNAGILEGNTLTHVMYAKGSSSPSIATREPVTWLSKVDQSKLFSSVVKIINRLNSSDENFFFEFEVEL